MQELLLQCSMVMGTTSYFSSPNDFTREGYIKSPYFLRQWCVCTSHGLEKVQLRCQMFPMDMYPSTYNTPPNSASHNTVEQEIFEGNNFHCFCRFSSFYEN